MLRAILWCWAFPYLISAGALRAQEFKANAPGDLLIAPLRSTEAYAARHGIPLQGIAAGTAGSGHSAGDTVIMLVTLFDGAVLRQWLVELTTVELTDEERGRDEEPVVPPTIFTSTGAELCWNLSVLGLELRTVGPFQENAATGAVVESYARQTVLGGFLESGFDGFCASVIKLRAANRERGRKGLDWWSVARKPFSNARIASDRQQAVAIGMTVNDERNVVNFPTTVRAFFDVAQKTPGLQQILLEMVDKKSLAWSALKAGGRLRPRFEPDNPRPLSPGEVLPWSPDLPPCYRFDLAVGTGGNRILNTEVSVTSADPPLLACAGVLGIRATSADGKKVVTIRVVSAQNGAAVRQE